MVKNILSALLLFLVVFLQSAEAVEAVTKKIYRDKYYTYEVVEVTEKTMTLQRIKRNKDVITVVIDRSRRPYLQVGDRVRYDKKNDRLRKTLPQQ